MESRIAKTFLDMVSISSESGQETQFIQFLHGLFMKEFNARCLIDDFGNLLVDIEPKNARSEGPILFSCHADTVTPGQNIKPKVNNGVIYSSGDTVLGADDKAGIAELVEAVRRSTKHPRLEIVISVQEESGLLGAKHLDVGRLKSKMGFLIDMDALESVVIGGPSHMFIDIEILGRAAHAGMEPEKGISAIVAAANAISRLELGRVDDETTANIGIINGGQIRNGIPEKVRIAGECRSLDHEKCLRLAETIKNIFEESAQEMGATANVKLDLAYKAIRIPEQAESVQIAKKAVESVGLKPHIHVICGGTDASIYNEKGIETVVIAFGGKREHSNEEHIAIGDMEKAAEIITSIFEQLS